MTKAFKLNWHIEVPLELQEGSLVDRWTEDGDFEPDCTVKVDDCGFFIYWKSETRVSLGCQTALDVKSCTSLALTRHLSIIVNPLPVPLLKPKPSYPSIDMHVSKSVVLVSNNFDWCIESGNIFVLQHYT